MAKSRTAQEGLVKMLWTTRSCAEWQRMVMSTIHCNATTREDMPLGSGFSTILEFCARRTSLAAPRQPSPRRVASKSSRRQQPLTGTAQGSMFFTTFSQNLSYRCRASSTSACRLLICSSKFPIIASPASGNNVPASIRL
jgi:hypothetical protein